MTKPQVADRSWPIGLRAALPTHPGRRTVGVSRRQIDLMADFNLGKDVKITIDLSKDDEIIGLEVLLSD